MTMHKGNISGSIKEEGWMSRAVSNIRFFLAVLRARPIFAVGYATVLVVCLVAIVSPWIAPYPPQTANPSEYLQSPGLRHWLGTDATGMDIFSRILYAPRYDLTIALMATFLAAILGSSLGAIVGYYQESRGLSRFIAAFVIRSSDVLQAFPFFVFAIAVVAVIGQSIRSVVLAIAFVNTPIYLRLMRSQVLAVRRMRFVEAAYIAGVSDPKILLNHVIPNSMAPVLAHLSVNIGWSVLLAAGLSFVGAGVEAPTPEWGLMIAMGFQNIVTGQWWPSVFPGLALAITVFGFALVGSSVEIILDPARRRVLSGSLGKKAGS
jgi:peptide/nickel transport system permease protein